ncbi:hypothetical protein NC653_037455 [Populus alba x Populus x berolinensis]|uniref:PRA1 family protein n=1 Tax=Populus alba x Populus x berolinensis TaxID=444605 RepID=A0AAD6LEZ7_9ROSI|nr:hypothetical protein NC653_037455 [Populus alba x Populus x berolinensis]
MAGHGTIDQRPSTMSKPTTPTDPEDWTGKNRDDFERPEFRLVCPFSIPSSPEAASLRIIRNLGHFALYYTHFVWIVLFITLIPQRKIIYKSMVLGLIAVATMIELIATAAGLHLVITLAATVPIVLIHAVLWVREDFFVEERTGGGGGGGELVSLIDESTAMV